jgi:hypothetical protein
MKNFNQKNNFESEIDEQRIGANITKEIENIATLRGSALEGAFRDMELAIGLKNNPILLKDIKTGGIAELRTADEIFAALKDGKLVGKELGRVEKGLLKSTSTSPGLRKSISIDFSKDKNVLGELSKNNRNTTAEIKEYLKGKGYPPESINEIVAQMKANGAIDAKGLLSKNAANVAKGGKTSKSLLSRTKELLSNIKIKKMPWKKLLVWGAGLGIGAYALWYFVKETSDVIPDGMPNTPPNPKDDWGPCLSDLVNKKQGKIVTNTSGAIVVLMSPTEKYPKGVTFYSNNRAVNNQTNDKGTWSCVGGKVQQNENISKTQMNESIGQIVKRVLNERFLMEQQVDSQLANDVEDMIDYLDFPVYGNDYVNVYNLLKKYANNGKYKQFADYYYKTGYQKSSLRSDINSITTIDAAPTMMKDKIEELLNQIESGKVTSSAPVSNQQPTQVRTTVNEQGVVDQQLNIVWDKDRKPGSGGGNTGGGTARKTYYDCTNVNIDTTPLTYGCKSSKIGEIQKCLGVSVDNKFGPNTRKALIDNAYDMSKGITKEIYTKVLSACNPSTSQTAGSTEGGADVKYLRTPIKMDLGQVPQMPAKNTSGTSSSQGMTDAQFYQSFVDSGLITRNLIGRIVYKGQVLEPEEKSKLDNQMATMGYVPTREAATDEGERYVWKRA